MSRAETVMAFASALEFKDYEKAADCLSPNFVYYGTGSQHLNKDAFLSLMQTLLKAIPTLRFHLSSVQEQGETVTASTHITGTHSRDLELPETGQTLEASYKEIDLPEQKLECSFEGETIAGLKMERAGLEQVLQEIGAPAAQH